MKNDTVKWSTVTTGMEKPSVAPRRATIGRVRGALCTNRRYTSAEQASGNCAGVARLTAGGLSRAQLPGNVKSGPTESIGG